MIGEGGDLRVRIYSFFEFTRLPKWDDLAGRKTLNRQYFCLTTIESGIYWSCFWIRSRDRK